MKISNIIALTSIVLVGYAMYAMQRPGVEQGESSAMGAGQGAHKREIPSLQQMTVKKIAQMLHDREMTIDLADIPKDPTERMGDLNRIFHFQAGAIADQYYRLYPDEFKGPYHRLELVQSFNKNSRDHLIDFSSDGQLLILSRNSDEGWTLGRWSVGEGNQFSLAGSGQLPTGWHPQWSNHVSRLVIRSNGLDIFNVQDTTKFIGPQTIPGPLGEPFSVEFSKDGRIFMYSNETSKHAVKIWAQDSNNEADSVVDNPYRLIQEIPGEQTKIHGANFDAFFGQSNNVFVLFASNYVEIWARDIANGPFKKIKEMSLQDLRSCTLSPDGRLLIAIKENGEIILFKGNNFSEQEVISGADNQERFGTSRALQFMPNDSSAFISISPLKIWKQHPDTDTFTLLHTGPDVDYNFALSPKGPYVALCPKRDDTKIEIYKFIPSAQEIWDHILIRADADIPELEEPEQALAVSSASSPAPLQALRNKQQQVAQEQHK